MTRTERRLFIGLLLLAVVLISRGSQALHGNAPYHLAISHSLAYDLDVDLDDEFAPDSDFPFRRDLEVGFARPGAGSVLYPSQGIGFGAALVPVYAVADLVSSSVPESVLEAVRWNRERSARDLISVALAVLFAWTGVLALRLDRVVRRAGAGHVLVVLLVFVTMPFLGASILALTEVTAALLTLWFVLGRLQPGSRASAVLPLALLPWLHLRYTILAIAGLAWVLIDRRRDGLRGAALVSPAMPVLASLAALALAQWWMFGAVVPHAAMDDASPAGRLWIGVVGLGGMLFDPDFGLLLVAPFWVLALFGAARLRRRRPAYVRFSIAAVAGLAIVAALTDAWRLAGPPALALAPALPLLVPFVAEAVTPWAGARRWVLAITAVWALSIAALTFDRPGRLWTATGTGIARMPAAEVTRLAQYFSAGRRLERAGIPLENAAFVERAVAGDAWAVRLFLRAGFDPVAALEGGARSGSVEVLDLLLGAGPEAGSAWTQALLAARREGHDAVVARLERAGASIDMANAAGETALMEAVKFDAADEVERLLASGADVQRASRIGRTALFFAARSGRAVYCASLIEAGADVNAADADGWTPLMIAVRRSHDEAARALLAAGADPDATSRLGWTALMLAAHDGDLDLVRTLIAHRADVNRVSQAGLSALVRAVQRGHVEIVRTLLRAGADPDLDVAGRTARQWATFGGQAALADLLIRGDGP